MEFLINKKSLYIVICYFFLAMNPIYGQFYRDYTREKKHIAKYLRKNFIDLHKISPEQIDIIDATSRMMKGLITTNHTYWQALINNRSFLCYSYHPKSLKWKKISKCIEIACYLDDWCEFCSSGLYYYDNKMYDYAKELWVSAANNNHIIAQHWLGFYYQKIEHNIEKAKYWYKKAANQNFALSQYQLGELYGAEHNYIKSFEWFEKSAKNGSAMGQLMMGIAYGFGIEGWYIKKDTEKAKYWLTLAIEQGIANNVELNDINPKLVIETFELAQRLLYKLENE